MSIYTVNLIWWLLTKRANTNNRFVKRAYSFIARCLLNKNGSYIGSGAVIKEQPIFPHGINGILISSGAEIGKGSVIFHQVTIGSNNIGDSNKIGSPTIGDNCYIGAGAKIIGNINIGKNVRIGANAVVVKDVRDNSVVVNQPARVIEKDGEMNNQYYGNGQLKSS